MTCRILEIFCPPTTRCLNVEHYKITWSAVVTMESSSYLVNWSDIITLRSLRLTRPPKQDCRTYGIRRVIILGSRTTRFTHRRHRRGGRRERMNCTAHPFSPYLWKPLGHRRFEREHTDSFRNLPISFLPFICRCQTISSCIVRSCIGEAETLWNIEMFFPFHLMSLWVHVLRFGMISAITQQILSVEHRCESTLRDAAWFI